MFLFWERSFSTWGTRIYSSTLEEKIVAAPGDPFSIRLSSPMITIGGGIIIDSGIAN